MVRIGINIPNELMKRLEPLKPELNISQVCRDALQAKAESHERMKASLDDGDIRTAVEKVGDMDAAFRAAVEVDWERLGNEDAAAWVKAAGWDEWEDLREDIDFYRAPNVPQWKIIFPPSIEGVPNFFGRRGELSRRESEMEKNHPGFSRWFLRNWQLYEPDRQAYMTAWLAYTDAVWKLVEQRREERYRELLAQRSAPPQPKIPEHILADVDRNS